MKKTKPEKPLFVPLKTRFFREFQNGLKYVEYRPEGPQWNAKVCRVGRDVVLSNGYGKQERMTGRIVSYQSEPIASFIPGWVDCYGQKQGPVACIGIQLNRS